MFWGTRQHAYCVILVNIFNTAKLISRWSKRIISTRMLINISHCFIVVRLERWPLKFVQFLAVFNQSFWTRKRKKHFFLNAGMCEWWLRCLETHSVQPWCLVCLETDIWSSRVAARSCFPWIPIVRGYYGKLYKERQHTLYSSESISLDPKEDFFGTFIMQHAGYHVLVFFKGPR